MKTKKEMQRLRQASSPATLVHFVHRPKPSVALAERSRVCRKQIQNLASRRSKGPLLWPPVGSFSKPSRTERSRTTRHSSYSRGKCRDVVVAATEPLHLWPPVGSFSKTNPPNKLTFYSSKSLSVSHMCSKPWRKTVGSFRKKHVFRGSLFGTYIQSHPCACR